jgi:hypothetical protein
VIVCWRTVRIPRAEWDRFHAWIRANRAVRERHGILFELVLDRSPRQDPPKTAQPPPAATPASTDAEDAVAEAMVVTAWASHDAFDAWINTPDRDRLTASPVHQAVQYGPITRYDVTGGYLTLDRLRAVAATLAAPDTRREKP